MDLRFDNDIFSIRFSIYRILKYNLVFKEVSNQELTKQKKVINVFDEYI